MARVKGSLRDVARVTGLAVALAGTIRGTKDGIDANIVLRRQADGTTRVESNFKGQLDRDPTLSRRFDAAYERYMGR